MAHTKAPPRLKHEHMLTRTLCALPNKIAHTHTHSTMYPLVDIIRFLEKCAVAHSLPSFPSTRPHALIYLYRHAAVTISNATTTTIYGAGGKGVAFAVAAAVDFLFPRLLSIGVHARSPRLIRGSRNWYAMRSKCIHWVSGWCWSCNSIDQARYSIRVSKGCMRRNMILSESDYYTPEWVHILMKRFWSKIYEVDLKRFELIKNVITADDLFNYEIWFEIYNPQQLLILTEQMEFLIIIWRRKTYICVAHAKKAPPPLYTGEACQNINLVWRLNMGRP